MSSPNPAVRDRLAQACLELLRIPSPTGQEEELVRHMKRWASSLSQIARDDVVKEGNALVVGQPDGQRPCVALVGHLDTVPPHPDETSPRQEEDRIYGVGASDMKGGIAVMQTLFETLDLASLPFALMLVLYDKEEGPYRDNGLEPLLERLEVLGSIDLAIAMEPTDNALQLGCMGSMHARLTFRGRAAHSARPWQGENAIHKAGPILAELLHRQPRDVEVEGLTFREAMNVTLAKGGRAANVLPDSFEINVNYRFAPRAPISSAIDAATREIQSIAADAEVQIVDIAPPGPVPLDNPILEHFRAHARVPVQPKQAWTDVARLAAFGIDAVNFGPGSPAQAHQRGEWVSHAALERAYELLSLVLSTPLEGMP